MVNSGRFTTKAIYGVGVYDLKTPVTNEGKCYSQWRSMLTRCYSEKYQSRQATYKGCVVDDSWKTYSTFKRWYLNNYIEGFELDKDLLGGGKVYSPLTCCFLPKRINLALPKLNMSGGFSGVRYNGYSYTTQSTNENGKLVHLGSFDDEEKAFDVYCKFKENVIRKLTFRYKNDLPERTYNALMEIDLTNYLHKLIN